MKRFLRVFTFVPVAALLFAVAGLPWVLLAQVELWWSPVVGFVLLALTKCGAGGSFALLWLTLWSLVAFNVECCDRYI